MIWSHVPVRRVSGETLMTTAQRLQRLLVGGFAACGIAVLLLACEAAVIGNNAAPSDGADLALFRDVLRRIERSYVEPVDHDQLVTHALKGALNSLDPHSDYMDEQEYRQML